MAKTSTLRLVRRRCKVCEWEGATVETEGADPGCPWCYAPTELIAELDSARSHAAALGRLGGVKGGNARAASLSAKRRREIALKAARARWRPKRPK